MLLTGTFKIGLLSLVITGCILIIAGGVLHGVFPGIYKKKVEKELVLSEDKPENVERWIKSPVPSYMSFTLFNVTNPEEVNARSAIPYLEEVGPYIYRQEKVKEVVGRNETLGTIDYEETTHYYFVPELNEDVDLDAEIYHINAPAIGFADKISALLPILKAMLAGLGIKFEDLGLTKTSATGELIIKNKVNEILFNGFEVPIFAATMKLAESLKDEGIKAMVSGQIPKDLKWSAFREKNGSTTSGNTIFSGVQGANKLAVFQKINGETKLDFFKAPGSWCNIINGTDGTQFPPDVKKNEYLFVYSADVCRSLQLEFSSEPTIEKIPAYRFVLSESVFMDPEVNGSVNVCFCHRTDRRKGLCFKKGILPIKECMPDKSVMAMSAPHFLNADEIYLEAFNGLKPNVEKHGTFLDIEPNTGAVIQGKKRLQVNIIEKKIGDFEFLSGSGGQKPFPFFWIEEGARIDKANALLLRKKAIIPKESVFWGSIAGIAVGAVLILLSIVVYIFKR